MNFGRFTLGEVVPLQVVAADKSKAPAVPTTAPIVYVYKPDGTKILASLMPPLDRYGVTGLFAYPLRLGSGFVTGNYRVAFTYKIGSQTYLKVASFDVVGSGSTDGAVVSMYHYERPQARYLVQLTDAGLRSFGRNPSV